MNRKYLTTTKTVTPASAVEAGDSLTYTVRFTNSGNSTAYESSGLDLLAQGTEFTALTGVTYHDSTAGTDTNITGLSQADISVAGEVGFSSTDGDSWDIEDRTGSRCTIPFWSPAPPS